MIESKNLNPELIRAMKEKKIDIDATLALLNTINSTQIDEKPAIQFTGLPNIDGKVIVNCKNLDFFDAPEARAKEILALTNLPETLATSKTNGIWRFERQALIRIGTALFAFTAYGVLNGGSATSYGDVKKNASINADVFNAIKPIFDTLAPLCKDKPKGITPAYLNPDGSPGESFLMCKMRILVEHARTYHSLFGKPPRELLPFFQMTSDGTDDALREAYREYEQHPWLKKGMERTGTYPTRPRTAKQPLIAAFTHSSHGNPRTIFTEAYGKPNNPLALPGGHGQSFQVLKNIYQVLLNDGYRFAMLGNVDNMGYYPDPLLIAVTALSGNDAMFEFTYRTPLDVKGGIVVTLPNGKITAIDIGQSIPLAQVLEFERQGKTVLANCGAGIFDLKILTKKIDTIIKSLPIHLTDQDKDAGKYSQAEQTTWEVIGLLDKPGGLAVEKKQRFLAAKMLTETILGSWSNTSAFPKEFAETARLMQEGIHTVLSGPCNLKLLNGKWQAEE